MDSLFKNPTLNPSISCSLKMPEMYFTAPITLKEFPPLGKLKDKPKTYRIRLDVLIDRLYKEGDEEAEMPVRSTLSYAFDENCPAKYLEHIVNHATEDFHDAITDVVNKWYEKAHPEEK